MRRVRLAAWATALALIGGTAIKTSALAAPSGRRWSMASCAASTCAPGTTCLSNHCVPLLRVAASVDNSGRSTLSGAQQLLYSAVVGHTLDAFASWTSPRVLSCTTSWSSSYGGTFATPTGSDAVNASDGANSLIWLSGSAWRHGASTLGLTTTTYFVHTNLIFDADTEMNNDVGWADNGDPQAYDVESVALHEAGHFLGLAHSPASTVAVMYPTISRGTHKRLLSALDALDVCTVYPGDPGGQGVPCTGPTSCSGGRVCEGAVQAGQRICTVDCSSPTDPCPPGYSCQPSSDGLACLSQVGTSDLCAFCATGDQCSTGVCLTDGEGINWCSMPCRATAQCGPGYSCQALSIGSFCVPLSPCANQCATAGPECPVGYRCAGGTCTPTGMAGDRCETSAWCTSCNACTSDPDEPELAFCRPCCDSGAAGTPCAGCARTPCDTGSTCVVLAQQHGSACLPTGGATICQSCTSTACQSGLTCIAGRCHASCNPASPGRCEACFDLGSGDGGACACWDEVAQEGDPCGARPTRLSACLSGLRCVASPTLTCRARCELSNPRSCSTGATCQLLSGEAICVPNASGQRCAACTPQGTCEEGLTCYGGRCYSVCHMSSAARCPTCVQTEASGIGVCACDDQIVGANSPCALPRIAWCRPGTLCVEDRCRAQCTPGDPNSCPPPSACRPHGGSTYCLEPSTGGGSGGGAGGGSSGGLGGAGGGAPSGTTNAGCGCTTGWAWPWAAAGVALLWFARRRERSP